MKNPHDAFEDIQFGQAVWPATQGQQQLDSSRGPELAVWVHPVQRTGNRAGIEPSVGSQGDSHGHALADTINGLYKAELIHRRGLRKTRKSVEMAKLEWVDGFSHQRLLQPFGCISPAETEANHCRHQLAEQTLSV